MQYTMLGKTGLQVSRFGLGCMRFPKSEEEAIEMVRYAVDNGVNYLDTAYMYPGSEMITGKALQRGYRNQVLIATKSPIWKIGSHKDFEKYLDEELKRLGTDHIDMYLLHNMSHDNWEKVNQLDGLTFLDKMIQKGKILHKSFSFHGTLPAFKQVVDAFDWEMAQIQLNILDENQQAGIEGLRYAADKGLAVVIMEPLRGGYMLANIPEAVADLVRQYPEKRSFIEWCFRWLYNMPEISVILSGASTLEQLKDNLRIFDESAVNVMSEADQNLIKKIQKAFESNNSVGCTSCGYCMPCPQGVSIPEIFKLYNSHKLMKTHWVDKGMYKENLLPSGSGADQCISCGICEGHCPQSLDIPVLLKKVHGEFTAETKGNWS
ncbi:MULTISPECIES: aldo/keto reductase [unclassified Dehalobacter]|uniref:aldo/keto reductase n=1 Tax=unclassified Dehalobacter TaxID=2635733 RepID=UPI000E6B7C69|nr:MULTISPECIES: aldo/keto reductase [unclassified Dehalobacter]RJE47168.1 aldo/keto reductase [Dehalobacter sp. MCB1]TCX53669.1 aldo/keto reductase [Dehalobacter sp. 14DCB1]TCX54972.1 aldo/keto reductase [Dehalobacter sp. 12DCB1]